MCPLLRIISLPYIKEDITLDDAPFEQTNDEILFTYYKNGNMRFYNLPKGGQAEAMLYDRGLISNYDGNGSRMKMYRKTIHTNVVKKVPVTWVSEKVIGWDELALLHDDIVNIVANREFELTMWEMGFGEYTPKGKPKSIEVPYKIAM